MFTEASGRSGMVCCLWGVGGTGIFYMQACLTARVRLSFCQWSPPILICCLVIGSIGIEIDSAEDPSSASSSASSNDMPNILLHSSGVRVTDFTPSSDSAEPACSSWSPRAEIPLLLWMVLPQIYVTR